MYLSQEVERIFGQWIPFSPRIYLLHNFSLLTVDKARKLLLAKLCVAASLLLAFPWGSAVVPSKEEGLGKARFLSLMNKRSALVKYCQGNRSALLNFKNIWARFFQFYRKTKQDFVALNMTQVRK